ncbi:MAG TPA: hypothetical protein VFG69_19010 [Nannocystaceae bacterium]|nr:hypothetical protein [Nannocystaceae bacterium]
MGIVALALLAQFAGSEPIAPGPVRGSGVVVVWEAPASCPTQDEVAAAVVRRVGERSVAVNARVAAVEGGFAAALELRSDTGTTSRSLTSPACTTLVDAIVLLAVVATDPVPTLASIAPRLQDEDAIPQPSPPPPVEPLPMITAAPPAEPPPRVDVPKPSPTRALQPRIAAFAIFGGQTLPGIDVGIRGAVGVATKRVHFDVTALYLGPRGTTQDGVRVEIDAWAVGARVCPVVPLPTARVELPICAVVGAGQLRGRATGARLLSASPKTAAWVTAAAAPELAIVLHRLVRIVVGAELGGTLVGPGFRVGTLGRVWKPTPWLARAQLGLEVRFR